MLKSVGGTTGTPGSVTSVGLTSPNSTLTVGNSPITTSGNITADVTTNAVGNTLLAQMPANTIKGNNTGSTANAADLTVAQVKTLLGISGEASGYLSTASGAGATNDTAPVGFDSTIDRLDVDTTSGAANWTGLIAGADNQPVYVRVTGANALTLNNQNAGSAAANRFSGVDDRIILLNTVIALRYYAGSVNRWVMMS